MLAVPFGVGLTDFDQAPRVVLLEHDHAQKVVRARRLRSEAPLEVAEGAAPSSLWSQSIARTVMAPVFELWAEGKVQVR